MCSFSFFWWLYLSFVCRSVCLFVCLSPLTSLSLALFLSSNFLLSLSASVSPTRARPVPVCISLRYTRSVVASLAIIPVRDRSFVYTCCTADSEADSALTAASSCSVTSSQDALTVRDWTGHSIFCFCQVIHSSPHPLRTRAPRLQVDLDDLCENLDLNHTAHSPFSALPDDLLNRSGPRLLCTVLSVLSASESAPACDSDLGCGLTLAQIDRLTASNLLSKHVIPARTLHCMLDWCQAKALESGVVFLQWQPIHTVCLRHRLDADRAQELRSIIATRLQNRDARRVVVLLQNAAEVHWLVVVDVKRGANAKGATLQLGATELTFGENGDQVRVHYLQSVPLCIVAAVCSK